MVDRAGGVVGADDDAETGHGEVARVHRCREGAVVEQAATGAEHPREGRQARPRTTSSWSGALHPAQRMCRRRGDSLTALPRPGGALMYLDGDTVHGNVISIGGGPGPTLNPYVNFPIKDNTILGNLVVQGWKGAWFGVLRDTVRGNVILADNVGVTIDDLGTPDSTEVATNTISGNLICVGNVPAAQVGDSGGTPNTVGGHKIGQCCGPLVSTKSRIPTLWRPGGNPGAGRRRVGGASDRLLRSPEDSSSAPRYVHQFVHAESSAALGPRQRIR